MLEAHDSEVLCLEYTRPQTGTKIKGFSASLNTSHHCLNHEMYKSLQLHKVKQDYLIPVRFVTLRC